MPVTAAIDNETLDHLLSVVNDAPLSWGFCVVGEQRLLLPVHRGFFGDGVQQTGSIRQTRFETSWIAVQPPMRFRRLSASRRT